MLPPCARHCVSVCAFVSACFCKHCGHAQLLSVASKSESLHPLTSTKTLCRSSGSTVLWQVSQLQPCPLVPQPPEGSHLLQLLRVARPLQLPSPRFKVGGRAVRRGLNWSAGVWLLLRCGRSECAEPGHRVYWQHRNRDCCLSNLPPVACRTLC